MSEYLLFVVKQTVEISLLTNYYFDVWTCIFITKSVNNKGMSIRIFFSFKYTVLRKCFEFLYHIVYSLSEQRRQTVKDIVTLLGAQFWMWNASLKLFESSCVYSWLWSKITLMVQLKLTRQDGSKDYFACMSSST